MARDTQTRYVVRLWDGFDGEWMDVFGPASQAACQKRWNKLTKNGTRATTFTDIDYYKVFPADTTMHFAGGRSMTRGS